MKQISKILLALIVFISLVATLCSCNVINSLIGEKTCAHVYGDWTVVSGEFCEERLHSRTCTLCGDVDYREGTEADHYWSDPTTVEPTCSKEGYDERVCRLCNKDEKENVVPATGQHDFIITGTDEPNCVSEGVLYSKCIVCDLAVNATFGEPTGEHDMTRCVAFEDYHAYYCRYCDTQEIIEPHIFRNGSSICKVCHYDSTPVYDIKIWVSERLGAASLFSDQILRFAELNGYKIKLSIYGVTEVDAGYLVAANVASAPDIFCFTQDYTNRLYNAGALAAPSPSVADSIIAANDHSSILSASVNGSLQAYPLTSDTGYYMYYDSSVITNPDSLEQIIADCEAAGKKIRFAADNAWYVASFFFATGCESEWIVDEDGQFVDVKDSFNSEEGLIAMKGLQKLTQSSAYESNADICDDDTAVWITGLWNDGYAIDLGFSATDLPSFTVDDVSYHMGSFSGTKLMGVKPTEDAAKAELLRELALYLTGYECQMERLNELRWCPSNLEAQANDQRIGCSALFEQNKYATPQGYIHGAWWDIAATLGREAKLGATEAELIAALGNYENSINELFNNTNDIEWSIIGGIAGTMWDVDFPMTETAENVYESEILQLNQGDEFLIRKDLSWDMYFGYHGIYGGNFKIENGGDYIIRITVLSEYEINVEILPVE